MDDEWFRSWIERGRWIFAKTMPLTPHWYVLRREQDDAEFSRAVLDIRRYGHRITFQGRPYVIYVIDGYKYWSMGWPLDSAACDGKNHDSANCTILINRAVYPEVSGVQSVATEAP